MQARVLWPLIATLIFGFGGCIEITDLRESEDTYVPPGQVDTGWVPDVFTTDLPADQPCETAEDCTDTAGCDTGTGGTDSAELLLEAAWKAAGEEGGFSCSTTGGAIGAAWLVGLTLLVTRRRED